MQGLLRLSHYLYSKIDKKNMLIKIYYGFQILKTLYLYDKTSLYLNAISFVEAGMKQTEVARAFNFDKSWMFRLMQIYRESGYQGILNIKKGPGKKVTDDMEKFIIERFDYYYKEHGMKYYRDKIISDVYNEYGVKIGYNKLRKTLKPHKEKIKSGKIEIGGKEKEDVEEINQKDGKDDAEVSGTIQQLELTKENISNSEKHYNSYSGLLLLNTFIKNLRILNTFTKIMNSNIEKIKRIIVIIIYMYFLSKTKIENYKELKHQESSELVDTRDFKYPDDIREVLRNDLKFEELMGINKLMLEYYIETEEGKLYWILIDGHVLKYYGGKNILKTFRQQDHRPVKGRVQYFMHSSEGLPLYFEINDAYNDFREIINKLIGGFEKVAGKKKSKKYLYDFDRGAYSYEELKYLKEEKKVNFIIWNKNDKTDYKKLNLDYKTIKIKLKGNKIDELKKKEIEAAVVEKNYKLKNPDNRKEFITLKKLVIKNGKKHSSFLTNDNRRSIDELAEAMTFRWRQEKGFEVEVKYRGLNDINSYRDEEFTEEVIKKLGYEENGIKYVDTDEYKKLDIERKKINREIKKHQQKLGKVVEEMKNLEKIKENKKYKESIKKIKDSKKELEVLKQKIEGCRKEIRKIDKLIAKGVRRLDYTQKYFMDIIRVACAHIDNDVMKVLSQYYKNRRDIFKMIDRILSTGGYIEKDKTGGLIVTLSRLNTKKENQAMESFIEYVNQENPTLLFDKSKKIVFK